MDGASGDGRLSRRILAGGETDMNAIEAAETAQQARINNIRKAIDRGYMEIDEAARKGETSVTLQIPHNGGEIALRELQLDGFHVEKSKWWTSSVYVRILG